MKTTKKIISLILVIHMILMCTLIPGVAALEVMEESLIMNENTEELLPIAANNCGCEDDDDCEHDWEFSSREVFTCGICGGEGNAVTTYCTKCYATDTVREHRCN